MKSFDNTLDFEYNLTKKLVFEKAITANINASMSEIASVGFDLTLDVLKYRDSLGIKNIASEDWVTTLVGSPITASNGLTRVIDDVQLGGTLTSDVTVSGAGHSLSFGNGISKLFASNITTSDVISHKVSNNGNKEFYADQYTLAMYYTYTSSSVSSSFESNNGRAYFNWTDSVNAGIVSIDSNGVGFSTDLLSSFYAFLKTTNLTTSNRSFEFPDIDGTLALISHLIPSISTVSSGTTLTIISYQQTIKGDLSGGTFTTVLPTAVGNAGYKFIFKKISSDSNAWTIDANSTETIDGSLTIILSVQYDNITIQSDGTNWLIIS